MFRRFFHPPPLFLLSMYSGPYCVATETFDGETPEDLSFEIGDIIILTERIDDSWLRGTVKGQTGMFPQVFVDVRVDIPVGVVKPSGEESVGVEVTAVFEFEGQNDEELTFKVRRNDQWVV